MQDLRAVIGLPLLDALARFRRARHTDSLRLETTLVSDLERVAERAAKELGQDAAPVDEVEEALTDCRGLLPCLHSTAAERTGRGCTGDALWSGEWARELRGGRLSKRIKGFEVNPRRLSKRRSAAHPKAKSEDVLLNQQFAPSTDCDIGSFSHLSHERRIRGPHVSVAREEHTLRRLSRLRGRVWLLLGTSIEENELSLVCKAFEQQMHLETVRGSQGNGRGSEGSLFWCTVPLLDFNARTTNTQIPSQTKTRPSPVPFSD